MKEELLLAAVSLLKKTGFEIANCSNIHSCFDIFAKKAESILLIKVISNIEALDMRTSQDLRKVSLLMSAIPLVIGDHMKNKKLGPGIIYSRYKINVLNLETLAGILREKEFPKVYSIRGNYCITIKPSLLVALRKKRQLSQKELAQQLNVSKQSIYRYESRGKISFDVAEKMMKLFEEDIITVKKSLRDIFPISSSFELSPQIEQKRESHLTKLQKVVISDLGGLGFKTSLTHAPFNLIAIESARGKVFTIISNDARSLEIKAELIRKISELLHCYKVCISEKEMNLDILAITSKELKKLSQAQELIDLLAEE